MPDLTVSGRLPKDDRNGLPSQITELLADPEAVHVGIVFYDVVKVTETPETGERVPTVRIRAWEPVRADGDAEEMRRLLRRATEKRTGQNTLPLELERELDALTLGDDDERG